MFIRPHPLRPLRLTRHPGRSDRGAVAKGRSADPAPYMLLAARQSEGSGLAQLIQRFFFEQVDSLAALTATVTAAGDCPDEHSVYRAFARPLAASPTGESKLQKEQESKRPGASTEAQLPGQPEPRQPEPQLPEPQGDSGHWSLTMTSPQGTAVTLTWQSAAAPNIPPEQNLKHRAIGQLVTAVNLRLADIAKLRQLGRLAFIDPLTGLGNSRQLRQCVDDEINRANRFGGGFTLLFVDLDKFKAINDTFGHAEGDRVLQRVAGVLTSAVRSVDQVFRLAGDEFVIVLAGAGARTSEAVVKRLKNALSADPNNPTCSVGIASYPKAGQTYNELLKVADQGMYLSKDHKDKACGRHGDRN